MSDVSQLLDAYRDAINDSWEFYDGLEPGTSEQAARALAARKALADRFEALERERDQANATASDAKFQNERLVDRVRALEDEAVTARPETRRDD